MIERLYVHNFRCLENFTLDMSGRPSTLLIGRNGAGKSTVRNSLALLRRIGRNLANPSKAIAEADFSHGRTDVPMRFEIELKLTNRRYKYALAFEWDPESRRALVAEEGLSVDGEPAFSRDRKQIHLAAGGSFGLSPQTFALPVINLLHDQTLLHDVKRFLADMVLVSPIPAYMTGFAKGADSGIDADAANLAAALRALLGRRPAAYAAVYDYIKRVIPDFASFENAERGQGGTQLVVTFEDDSNLLNRSLPIAFDLLSDGEKCLFLAAYVAALYESGSGAFCFWDEPDNHLSLAEVGQFVTGLRKSGSRGGGQFVATSHHPEAIRKFTDEGTLVLSRKSHVDPTVVRPLSEFQYTGDLINALIRDEIVG